jgi:hypothetical protein
LFCVPTRKFTDSTELLDHVNSYHQGIVSEDLSQHLPNMCLIHETPALDKCYVCSISESEWQKQKMEGQPNSRLQEKSFLEHIGYCMHRFALWALPEVEDETTRSDKPVSKMSVERANSDIPSTPTASLDYSNHATAEQQLATSEYRSRMHPKPSEKYDITLWREQVSPGLDPEFINGPEVIKKGTYSYLWDSFATYRLRQSDLQMFLTKTFGNYNFFLEASRPAIIVIEHS